EDVMDVLYAPPSATKHLAELLRIRFRVRIIAWVRKPHAVRASCAKLGRKLMRDVLGEHPRNNLASNGVHASIGFGRRQSLLAMPIEVSAHLHRDEYRQRDDSCDLKEAVPTCNRLEGVPSWQHRIHVQPQRRRVHDRVTTDGAGTSIP